MAYSHWDMRASKSDCSFSERALQSESPPPVPPWSVGMADFIKTPSCSWTRRLSEIEVDEDDGGGDDLDHNDNYNDDDADADANGDADDDDDDANGEC